VRRVLNALASRPVLDDTQRTDLAGIAQPLSIIRLVAVVLCVTRVVVSPDARLVPDLPWLLPACVVLAGFAVAFLVRPLAMVRYVAGTWWWPILEGSCLTGLLVACGTAAPVGTLAAVMQMFFALIGGWRAVTMAVVGDLVILAGIVGGVVPPLEISAPGAGAQSVGILLVGATYLVAGAYARRLVLQQYGAAARACVLAESQGAVVREQERMAAETHTRLSELVARAHDLSAALTESLVADGDESAGLAVQLAGALTAATEDLATATQQMGTDSPGDVASVCRSMVAQFSAVAPSIAVDLTLPDGAVLVAPPVQHEVALALWETLDNIQRHSHATSVTVSLEAHGPLVTLTVADNGIGLPTDFDLATMQRAGHFGLLGLHERADRVQGTLSLRSDDRGTSIALRFPSPVMDGSLVS